MLDPGAIFAALPSSDSFMPHGHCYLWTPILLWLNAGCDGLIAVAYFSIPWWLLRFARERPDMPFGTLLLMFGTFITACGATHVMDVWNIWHAAYWTAAGFKALTVGASLTTAAVLWRLMPLVRQLPSPAQLQESNRSLELRVAERTQELQAANRALEEERTRLNAMIETAMDAIITTDADGRIVVFNRAAETMFGRTAAEVSGRPLAQLLPDLDPVGGTLLAAPRTSGTALPPPTRQLGITVSAVRADGQRFPAEASVSTLATREGEYRTAIIRDISARVSAEASLRHLADIVESSGDAIISESLDGRITSWNDAARKLLGWDAEEMIGQPLDRVIPRDLPEAALSARTRMRAGDEVKPFDASRIRKDGSTVAVSVTLSAIRDYDGVLTGFSAITRDMTEKRLIETELKSALREQQTLLKEVYHRVKNNLQVVTSLFNLQLRSMPAGPARDTLEAGASRVRSMALVHEMLYQSGDLSSVDLARYIEDLCTQLGMAHNAGERGIRIVARSQRIHVSLDIAVPLGLALNELIVNSLKHGFSGQRAGRIEVQLSATGPGHAALEVSDNGVGFPPDMEERKPASLGLRLVVSLGRQLDARLTMENRQGAYSRLEFPIGSDPAASD